MPLFQKTVISKYLNTQNQESISKKWEIFRDHFHNPGIQENIRNSKEEQYQGEFLIDLFVKVLGYTKNPTPSFNLTTEHKNVKDSKKADGAIIISDIVVGIIELKGTNTTDLSKIEDQAFGYKNNQLNCKYVITSNFEKLRLYIDNAIEHIEFNLFELSQEQFNLLYLCLAYENVKQNIPGKIKDESLSQEDAITKKLYKDYSVFKRELFQNLTAQNPQYDALVLFQKSQKLLDRLLFLFFGEDRGLLPPNSVRLILQQWEKLRDLDEYVPLYHRFRKYFGYLNTGFKGKHHDVFAYNGGLFKPDEILDSITIDDDLLFKHASKVSEYDFASEVDVNILGHIFENSLNEIDEIKAQLDGQEIDKSKTKRKKDGVFYTPKYITKYIVENTVGKLCEEKKLEFGIIEEEYFTDKKRQLKTKENLLGRLNTYRDWLHQLTIVDPACGSGAFLNEALNFLITEHNYIDELETKLTGSSFTFTYHSESILENNLFGVDLNEESVEIAKLSLWLRTAEPNRKLNSLNDNIKCGNSLIDDAEIAGDKAFSWEQEFPQVFAKGGFDVVIGNPPYVNIYNMSTSDRDYFNSSNDYHSTYLKYDLYVLFLEKGLKILVINGVLGYIIPSVILSVPYGKNIRESIIKENSLDQIIDFSGYKVFSDAMVDSCILLITKEVRADNIIKIFKPNKNIINFQNNYTEINQKKFLLTDSFQFRLELNSSSMSIINKIISSSISLESIYYVSKGIVAFSKVDKRVKNDFLFNSLIDEKCKPYLEGKDVQRYAINFDNKYLQYDESIMSRPTFPELHTHSKILVRAISDGLNATYDDKGYFIDQKLIICSKRFDIEKFIAPAKRPKSPHLNGTNNVDDLSILSLLNSQLYQFYYKKMLKGGVSILPEDIRNFPIYHFKDQNQKPFIQKAEEILKLNKNLQEISAKFHRTCDRKFDNLNWNKKLQDWYNLSYADFIKELSKQKIKLTLSEEAEWADYFDQEKRKALEIQSKIESTDKEIDQMVYELYGLSEKEIEIVENS
ncbi:N-6 DNA methylase [Chryseobacterium sp. cx-311]|uniref:Eco57I restriction-modification methylase domain-containing protein n=1 Tax=Marnyiella aurantia TaxID=2758037 RepID=UPI001AE1DDC8|nr:TaqI-like C-terminal specificity domain-containing protein [Marnyiella aurantia]MBP0612324.1 N-6 DNA methylase [Marnyiella aurantia]